MDTPTHKLTPEVCALLGVSPAALNSWLSRNERFKPKARTPTGAMLWTDAEIDAVKVARNAHLLRRPGRK